jgi:phosphoglycolate phosphatase
MRDDGAMNASLDSVLFDLDGTLVDSEAGILGSLRAAFAEVGLPVPEAGLGRELLGPPLYASLPPLVGEAATEAIVPAYRRIYADTGWLLSTPYEGIEPVLRELAGRGLRLAVATSKQEAAAELIVDKQGWGELFTHVCGDTPRAERPTKAAVIGAALSRLGSAAAVMVGDRHFDVEGARAHGLGCHGAGWGYGAPGELIEAGALTVCASPTDLLPALGGRG